jgi:hypothetical protein
MASTGIGNLPLPPNNQAQKTKANPQRGKHRGPHFERNYGKGILEGRYYATGNFCVFRWNSGYLTKYPSCGLRIFQQIQEVAQPANFLRDSGFSNYGGSEPYQNLGSWPANATYTWLRTQPEHKAKYPPWPP